ncbi:unnamed protein product [marine sediment metagenome]|uniref:Uncharacterized protein n=1 Tax=marine sediment metagenome TaxID=412755 RepID=X0YYV8_9ZZZZ
MTNESLWRKLKYDARKQGKANKSSLSKSLFDITMVLLAVIVIISAVHYLSLWRW